MHFVTGDRVRISLPDHPSVVASMKIMLTTSLSEAAQSQRDSAAPLFNAALKIFGDIQVLWAGADDPGVPTFYDDELRTVNGFPILMTPEGSLGLDGKRLNLERIE